MKRWLQITYESLMIIFAITSIVLFWYSDSKIGDYLVKVIWLIFVVDVAVRIISSKIKWKYVVKHPFEIVSIIPLDDSLLLARFARLFQLFRMKTILTRYIKPVTNYLGNLELKKMTLFSLIMILIGCFVVFMTTDWGIWKSILWTFLNFIKFNYEKEINENNLLIIAVIIKLLGVLYIGILVSHSFKYMEEKRADKDDQI